MAGITSAVITAAEDAVKQTYLDSFHLVFLASVAFGGLAIIAALSTKSLDARRDASSRAVTMENEVGVHGYAEKAVV